jgi:DNA-binding MarR family transcriptional regulator
MTGVTTAAPGSRETDDRTTEIIDTLAPLLANHRQQWAARCHARGVSILGFQVLALLEMHEAIPMGHLADELDVALPNATGLVNRMEERGLIARRDDPTDRRVVLVELTSAGRRLIREMEAERRARMRRLFGSLDPIQQDRLLQSVQDLITAARRLTPSEEAPS